MCDKVREKGLMEEKTVKCLDMKLSENPFMTSCHADLHIMRCRHFANRTRALNRSVSVAMVTQLPLLNLQVYDSLSLPFVAHC